MEISTHIKQVLDINDISFYPVLKVDTLILKLKNSNNTFQKSNIYFPSAVNIFPKVFEYEYYERCILILISTPDLVVITYFQ